MLSEDEWKYIEEKYGNLLYQIGHRISGDKARDFDDNLQDLRVAVLVAVQSFLNQKGKDNGTIDEFLKSSGFDKYLKTTLWHTKANIGKGLKKRYKLNRDSYTLTLPDDNDESSPVECFYSKNDTVGIEEYISSVDEIMSDEEKKLIDSLISSPSLLLNDGRISLRRASIKLGMSGYKIKQLYKKVKEKLEKIYFDD